MDGAGQLDEGEVVGEQERVPVLVGEELVRSHADLTVFVLADVVSTHHHIHEASAESGAHNVNYSDEAFYLGVQHTLTSENIV